MWDLGEALISFLEPTIEESKVRTMGQCVKGFAVYLTTYANYTAQSQRHMCMNNLHKVITRSRTPNLMITKHASQKTAFLSYVMFYMLFTAILNR